MTSHPWVLSQYPLSRDYTDALRAELGADTRFLTLTELRSQSFPMMLRALRSLGKGPLAIGLEDPTSEGSLPILKLVAAASSARRLLVYGPELAACSYSRASQVPDAARFAAASVDGLLAVRRSAATLRRLASEDRVEQRASAGRKRVAYINTNLWFGQKAGGSVGHISGVANGLLEHGYELDYLTVGGRLLIRDQARHLELVPPATFGLPFEANLFRFDYSFEAQVLPHLDVDATAFLYQRLSLGNFGGVRLSRRTKLPLVVEYNGSEVWVAEKWGRGLRFPAESAAAEAVTLNHAHLVVTISDVLRDELMERGIPEDRVVTYPNCIDPETFDPTRFSTEEIAGIRQANDIPADACVATFVGTFGAWHGAEVFAEAIKLLCRDYAAELQAARLEFLFVGDGLRMPEVRRILDDQECRPFVHFAGLVPQAEAPLYLAASDILVAPHVPNADGTRFFGSPTKLFEYLAMGKAIVASDLDQIGQVLANSLRLPLEKAAVKNDELAVLLPAGHAGALSKGLLELARQPTLRSDLGQNARREALSKYTWRRHVGEILNGLEALEI